MSSFWDSDALWYFLFPQPISLNEPVSAARDHRVPVELGEMLPDRRTPSPDRLAEQTAIREAVHEALQEMGRMIDHRWPYILKHRYGLDGADVLTLQQIGDKLGLSRERVRQIQALALRDLRARLWKWNPNRREV